MEKAKEVILVIDPNFTFKHIAKFDPLNGKVALRNNSDKNVLAVLSGKYTGITRLRIDGLGETYLPPGDDFYLLIGEVVCAPEAASDR